MAGAIFPDMADTQPFTQRDVRVILDEMVRKGNRVAEERRSELAFLENAFKVFSVRIKEQGLQTMSWSDAADVHSAIDVAPDTGDGEPPFQRDDNQYHSSQGRYQYQLQTEQQYHPQQQQPDPQRFVSMGGDESTPLSVSDCTMPSSVLVSVGDNSQHPDDANAIFLQNIGISADDFLNIVDQMGNQDFNTFQTPYGQ